MLFLILAWRTRVPRVSDILLSSTRNNGYGSVCHEPLPITALFTFLFPLTGRSPHFRFGVPAKHLASLSFPLVSGYLRLLSTNICWYPFCDLHSFLTVTFLMGCHCSFQREDSINLISIVSVGYHVTQVPFLKSLVWCDLGLNPGLPDHWWTLYPWDQWTGYIYVGI